LLPGAAEDEPALDAALALAASQRSQVGQSINYYICSSIKGSWYRLLDQALEQGRIQLFQPVLPMSHARSTSQTGAVARRQGELISAGRSSPCRTFRLGGSSDRVMLGSLTQP
jgi:hypothetical protein